MKDDFADQSIEPTDAASPSCLHLPPLVRGRCCRTFGYIQSMNMVHHFSVPVADLGRSGAFYDAALAPLGYVRAWAHEVAAGYREAAIGYGLPGGDDEFAIRLRAQGFPVPSDAFHIAFRARSREAVTAFYRAALEHGGSDNGGVGLHLEYSPDYFAAFVFDPDGYRIEAVINEER